MLCWKVRLKEEKNFFFFNPLKTVFLKTSGSRKNILTDSKYIPEIGRENSRSESGERKESEN